MCSSDLMSLSFGYLAFFTGAPWPWLLATGAFMAIGAAYILTKPNRAPGTKTKKS